MARSDEALRSALLRAAEEQLVAAPDGDIATRAVCEAVGVTQPVLYRVFGDKRGLLDALADAGLERYAARKAELEVSDDRRRTCDVAGTTTSRSHASTPRSTD